VGEVVSIWLFWGALSLLVYTYLGYPLLLTFLGSRKAPSELADALPTVTVVVAAHNEEHCIAQKVRNILEHDYPCEDLEVIIVSDGSTDRTESIVRSLAGPRVRLVTQPQRQGKNAALNRGTTVAQGEIVVFSDADAMLTAGALQHLVAPFCDATVGLVSGQGFYGAIGNGTPRVVSNAYVRYEAFLKYRESALGFVAAADGALYAMRRVLYQELPSTQVHDLFHPIQMALAGYRSVFVPQAYTVEPPSPDASSEYRRHVRIIAQGLLVFLIQTPRLLARGCVKAWWILLSHRFLRWSSAAFLLIAFVTNVALAGSAPIYTAFMAGQIGFYTLALAGAISERWHLPLRLLAVPYFFCVVSLAGVGGFLQFLRGEGQSTWTPTHSVS
jgi:cellulose synthase/poly-beta-1,6-N-acetylglucosamine synthase-like glycosyltransferase